MICAQLFENLQMGQMFSTKVSPKECVTVFIEICPSTDPILSYTSALPLGASRNKYWVKSKGEVLGIGFHAKCLLSGSILFWY